MVPFLVVPVGLSIDLANEHVTSLHHNLSINRTEIWASHLHSMLILALALGVALLAIELFRRLYHPRHDNPRPPCDSSTEKGTGTPSDEDRTPGGTHSQPKLSVLLIFLRD